MARLKVETHPDSAPTPNCCTALMDPSTFVGRAPEQVKEFLKEEVQPVLDRSGRGSKQERLQTIFCRYSGQLEGSVSLAV